MNGILNINKPQGLTSFEVVARVKRITGERHTGHAGTLDPLATGVLPICLGKATRVIEYLFNQTKTYLSEIEFGIATDTYDSTGKILRTVDVSGISLERVEKALEGFRGVISQIPPMYSALKHKGRPLYKLARQGIEVERPSRPAQIFSLEITNWQPPVATLEIVCGKGTYIRSLANDLGEALGYGAVMKSLIRSRVGPFDLQEALTLAQLEEAARLGLVDKYLFPPDFVLDSFAALVVNAEQQCALIHGNPVTVVFNDKFDSSTIAPGTRCRVYTADGSFLGVVRYESENHCWRPEKIFFEGCCGVDRGLINHD